MFVFDFFPQGYKSTSGAKHVTKMQTTAEVSSVHKYVSG